MLSSKPDIRYKADGRQIARALQIVFPVCLRVLRPTAVHAIVEARRVIELLSQEAGEAKIPGGRFGSLAFDTAEVREGSYLTIQQKSPREVLLIFSFALILNLDETDFWSHAESIAAAADFLQGFGIRPHEKGVEFDIEQPARTIDPKPNPAAPVAESSRET